MMQKQEKKNICESVGYHRTQLQKEIILQKLKEQGCRITKQRLMLLDIILQEECSCCQELYYIASKRDEKIGSATVYRMINTLEEIGAISRKNMYKIACCAECEIENACTVEFDDGTVMELSATKWNRVIREGLTACGYSDGKSVCSVSTKPCRCADLK